MVEKSQRIHSNEMGCGLIVAMFQRGSLIRPSSAIPSLKNTSSNKHSNDSITKMTKRGRAGSREISFVDSSVVPGNIPTPKLSKKPSPKSASISPRPSGSSKRPPLNGSTEKSPKIIGLHKVPHPQVTNATYTRKLRKEPSFTESELSMRVAVRKKATSSGVLYRASSSNAMLFSHLGNLKQPRVKISTTSNIKTSLNYLTVKRGKSPISTPMLMVNITKNSIGKEQKLGHGYHVDTPKNKLDPELLKESGNKSYKEGRFEDALFLYCQAIAQDPSKASYYSNKSAALVKLGRLIEAVFECKVALRIDPTYERVHQRLAKLYLRLGEGEKSIRQYKHLGPKVDLKEVSQAQALEKYIRQIKEARRLSDWVTVEEESQKAISAGADSAPQIYAAHAEALLNLGQHEEAYSKIKEGPDFDINLCTQFFGGNRLL